MILCANPRAQYLARKPEIDAAVNRVLDSGWYVLGQEVAAFEEEFAAFHGVEHAIGIASGTDALHLAMTALDIGPGDEVLTVSHTAVATVAGIAQSGATPVLVDIDPATYTLDPEQLRERITTRTKAIVPVHLYGRTAAMAAILDIAAEHDLPVVEDCAQATGAFFGEARQRVGTLGTIGCFSFYPTKNLAALGDGGALITSDSALAERLRRLREYGWDEKRICQSTGWNSRLDEVQAAVLRTRLKYLDADNAVRASRAGQYRDSLQSTGLVLPEETATGGHVYHQFVVRSPDRDALQTFLKEEGVQTLIHYATPTHCHPAWQHLTDGDHSLPHTEAAAAQVLSLPVYPEVTESEVDQIISVIRRFSPSSHAS